MRIKEKTNFAGVSLLDCHDLNCVQISLLTLFFVSGCLKWIKLDKMSNNFLFDNKILFIIQFNPSKTLIFRQNVQDEY
ncbi:MAG: hypothetical protein IJ881_06395 [Neisseriaceae bacterium]|nr:hypothetical protein [Neisseriaceae bacterium]MBR3426171.1 hypothetical protein [Neisseriaceae bacterium]